MNPAKRRALRFALYLASIEIQPVPYCSSYQQWAAELQIQYRALTPEQRGRARCAGRQRIKVSGSLRAALKPLALSISRPPDAALSTDPKPRALSREEMFALISRRWSILTPPCPHCRMRNGFPKRSWPSREWADEVWGRQHDRQALCVYPCPAQPGFWHLGHIRPACVCDTGGPPLHLQHTPQVI